MAPFELDQLLPVVWVLLQKRVIRPYSSHFYQGFPKFVLVTEEGDVAWRWFRKTHRNADLFASEYEVSIGRHDRLIAGPPIAIDDHLDRFLLPTRMVELAELHEWWAHRDESVDVESSRYHLGAAAAVYGLVKDPVSLQRIYREQIRLIRGNGTVLEVFAALKAWVKSIHVPPGEDIRAEVLSALPVLANYLSSDQPLSVVTLDAAWRSLLQDSEAFLRGQLPPVPAHAQLLAAIRNHMESLLERTLLEPDKHDAEAFIGLFEAILSMLELLIHFDEGTVPPPLKPFVLADRVEFVSYPLFPAWAAGLRAYVETKCYSPEFREANRRFLSFLAQYVLAPAEQVMNRDSFGLMISLAVLDRTPFVKRALYHLGALDMALKSLRIKANLALGESALPVILYDVLRSTFNLEEIRSLAFELEVPYDDLGAEGRDGKARELVEFMKRRGSLSGLASRVRSLRPGVDLTAPRTPP